MRNFIIQILFVINIVLKIGKLALVILSLINYSNGEYDAAIYQLVMATLLEASKDINNPYKD